MRDFLSLILYRYMHTRCHQMALLHSQTTQSHSAESSVVLRCSFNFRLQYLSVLHSPLSAISASLMVWRILHMNIVKQHQTPYCPTGCLS